MPIVSIWEPLPADEESRWEVHGAECIDVARLQIWIMQDGPVAAMVSLLGGIDVFLKQLSDVGRLDGDYEWTEGQPLEVWAGAGGSDIEGRLGVASGRLTLAIDRIAPRPESEDGSGFALRFKELELAKEKPDLGPIEFFDLRDRGRRNPIIQSAKRFAAHLASAKKQQELDQMAEYKVLNQWVYCRKCKRKSETARDQSCRLCGALIGDEPYSARIKLLGANAQRLKLGTGDGLTLMGPGWLVTRQGTVRAGHLHDIEVSVDGSVPPTGEVFKEAQIGSLKRQEFSLGEIQGQVGNWGPPASLVEDPGWLGGPAIAAVRPGHELDPVLNDEQQEVVRRILGMEVGQLMLVQGPPGTGKTTAIVEAIRQTTSVDRSHRVVMSSHSNDAVDTAQERLLAFSAVRQGRFAEARKVATSLRHTLIGDKSIAGLNLVLATCNKIAVTHRLRHEIFDWGILDEANKAQIHEVLPLLPLAKRWVLVGDQKQLPPVLEAELTEGWNVASPADGLVRDSSFYEWMWDRVPITARKTLRRQYRMREPIGALISDLFYQGQLLHESKNARLNLRWPLDRELVWVDTGDQNEYRDASRSLGNEFEVALCHDLACLIKVQDTSASIAVISMYRSQVEQLSHRLKNLVAADDIQSVDAFEGQERDAVILSLVRSNDPGLIGFLKDAKRVNVAMSRAKKLLVVVGDMDTVIKGGSELFGPIATHIQARGLVAGPGAIVKACGEAKIPSLVARFGRPGGALKGRKPRLIKAGSSPPRAPHRRRRNH
ncbi:MAG: DEAD/DEAH box helicase family protein [Candidatus Dormibacteraeota bacterium]|nr:DEAD/DEAH box helicase family protein [Candidatus Dormibacteraeota bacterium]